MQSLKSYQNKCNIFNVSARWQHHFAYSRYAESIDVLQNVLEQYGAICPIHIIGDRNAQLHNGVCYIDVTACTTGYQDLTHTQEIYSVFIHDFINDNDVCVADFNGPQHVQYTYVSDSTELYVHMEWIDRCLTTSRNTVR